MSYRARAPARARSARPASRAPARPARRGAARPAASATVTPTVTPTVTVDVTFDRAARGLPPLHAARLARRLRRMVTAAARRAGRSLEAAFLLTTDPVIHALNRDYRGKDRATDVLAFAQQEGPHAHPGLLGDVVVSIDTARRQARRRGPDGLEAELGHLAAHGLCHLLGYDHRDDAEEAEMNARAAALVAEAARRGRVRPA